MSKESKRVKELKKDSWNNLKIFRVDNGYFVSRDSNGWMDAGKEMVFTDREDLINWLEFND